MAFRAEQLGQRIRQLLTGQLLTKEMKKRTVAHPVLMLFDVQKTNKQELLQQGLSRELT